MTAGAGEALRLRQQTPHAVVGGSGDWFFIRCRYKIYKIHTSLGRVKGNSHFLHTVFAPPFNLTRYGLLQYGTAARSRRVCLFYINLGNLGWKGEHTYERPVLMCRILSKLGDQGKNGREVLATKRNAEKRNATDVRSTSYSEHYIRRTAAATCTRRR